ncbi:hypothetical protein H2248_008844 [Termitomyces sp. 'cryptogamus']|nr:hypothetical protein H2248_008844 [Termitomyces sp. 'cryptogamus']
MSARTPFMPIVRPPSRLAAQEDTQTAHSPFTVDPNSPLNASTVPKNQVDANSQADATKNVSLSVEAQPLNTSSLLKGRNSNQQGHSQSSTRRPFQFAPEKAPIRPGTADPRSKLDQKPNRSNSLNILAPIPRQAPRPSSPSLSTNSVSGIFTSNVPLPMFRLPNLPLSTPNDNQSKNDTHISNSALGFPSSNPHALPDMQKSQLPSPPNSLRSRGARNIVTTDLEIPPPPPPFTLNFSNSNQTGPQRVLLNPDGTRGTLADYTPIPDDMQLTLNRTNSLRLKRSYPDRELDSEHQNEANDFKRYKKEDDGHYQRAKSVASHPSSPGTVSVHSLNQIHTPDHSHRHMSPMDGHVNYFTNNSSGLTRLLGCEVDAYVDHHVEQYEQIVERWKGCTMEEWIAGAEEQAARYTKILDFVKNHMSSKMRLFASFDVKIDGHQNILADREKALEGVKTRLVQQSAHALGHAR